ncbi:hypothetical protein PMIN02_011635, partial [Paraphaeosphaeria minitans]
YYYSTPAEAHAVDLSVHLPDRLLFPTTPPKDHHRSMTTRPRPCKDGASGRAP